jgi:GNAT superfamily N-acetyltransferase
VGKLRQAVLLLRSGKLRTIARAAARHVYSDHVALGLRRPVAAPFPTPKPGMALEIRPVSSPDAPLFKATAPHRIVEGREATYLLESGIRTCYVAVTKDGEPCYVQYLVDPSQTSKLRTLQRDMLLPLDRDEALLAAAFSPPRYRGRGIMLHVVPELAKKAGDLGARWLVLYASAGNLPMLKACKWCGFEPFVLRRTRSRFFGRRSSFTPLPEGTPYPFEVDDWSKHLSLARSSDGE